MLVLTAATLPFVHGAGAVPQTLTFNSTADATVHEGVPTSTRGTVTPTDCFVNDDLGSRQECRLKFGVAGLLPGDTVTAAKILIRNKGNAAGTKLVNLSAVAASPAWAENTITWNNRPARLATVLGSDSTHATGTDAEFTMPAATIPGNGTFSFALWSPPNSYSVGMNWHTKENTIGAPAPRLVLTINRPAAPVAALTVTPNTGDAPIAVTLDASGSSDADGDIASYAFNPGDGSGVVTQASPIRAHTYAAPGTYTASVTVTDAGGRTSTASAAPVTVTQANRAPTAAVTVTPATGDAPLTVTVDGSASTDPDADTLEYRFDFGDGTFVDFGPDPTAEHTYAAAGTYTVIAAVRDPDGLADEEIAEVEVTEPPAPRVLDVGASSNKPGTASKLASMQDLDGDLADAAGTTAPAADFWHVYNGGTMPTSWSTSNGAASAANGWGSMSNIKWTPGEIRTAAGRTKFNGFLASIPPPPFKVYLIGQHEPENDPAMSDPAARQVWQLDQAEFVKLVVDFDPTGQHVIPMSVFMGDPPRSWDDFDFSDNLRPGDADKMICGWDAYPRARAATSTLPDRTDDPEFKYGNVADWCRTHGFTRLGIAETTLNNDAGVPQTLVDQWWAEKLPAWLRVNDDVEVLTVYDASGPAAGTDGYINTPGELSAVADLMLNGV